MKIILLIFALILYKFATNLILLIQMKRIQNEFFLFVNGKNDQMTQKRTLFKKLINRADIKDAFLPTVANMGYGQLASYKASVIDNFPNLQVDHVKTSLDMMDDAIGVFRSRCFETFNPFFWIETLIFLPKSIFSYLGVKAESIFIKLFQLIYWLLLPLIYFFRESINNLIINLINKL